MSVYFLLASGWWSLCGNLVGLQHWTKTLSYRQSPETRFQCLHAPFSISYQISSILCLQYIFTQSLHCLVVKLIGYSTIYANFICHEWHWAFNLWVINCSCQLLILYLMCKRDPSLFSFHAKKTVCQSIFLKSHSCSTDLVGLAQDVQDSHQNWKDNARSFIGHEPF